MKLLAALLASATTLLAADGLPNQPYLYVQGKAEVEKAADMVSLRFELSSLQPTQAAANKIVQAQATQVFELLKTTGIENKDVVASDLSSQPEYEDQGESKVHAKLLGYRVRRPFQVRVRAVATFPKLVNDLLAMKIEEFGGITEGLAEEKKLHDDVWEKALQNARDRAEKTAKAAGMKIDSVFAISPVAFPSISPAILGSPEAHDFAPVVAEGPEKSPTRYQLAPVTVSQDVHVIYLISPAK